MINYKLKRLELKLNLLGSTDSDRLSATKHLTPNQTINNSNNSKNLQHFSPKTIRNSNLKSPSLCAQFLTASPTLSATCSANSPSFCSGLKGFN